MKSFPKISIITISYNSAATIEKTIRSVAAQNYGNKEYIVIDGKSSDGTQSIVNNYSQTIDHFISEPDNGISDAFNKGLALATGDLIVCLNSDDYLLPNVLEDVAMRYDGEADICCGDLLLWNDKTGDKRVIHPSDHFPTLPFFCRPAHQGMFIRRELYKTLQGYDTRLRYAMDLDFLMRATKYGAKFQRLNMSIAVFRLGGATSDSIFKKKKEYLYLIKKNGGSTLQAYLFYYFLVITQTTKKLLQKTGVDVVRRLRYKSA